MSSNKINTPRPTLIIPQYPYENMYENHKKQEEKRVKREKQQLTPDRNNETNQLDNQYYVLHGQDPPDIYSSKFARVRNIVRYGIFFDMVAAFMFFVFNPYFLFFSFFNLLFVYLGWYGIQSYESSYLGSYAIYMFMKIVSMTGFFVYVCSNQSSYFHTNHADTSNTTFILFCSTYSFFLCLYVFFYVNILKYIKLLFK